MQINNTKNSNLTFNAGLNLRGNVRNLSEEQAGYIRKLVSQIGNSVYDKVDIFVHTQNEKNAYSMIDIGGYINSRLKAAHVSYTDNNIYDGIIDGLKFLIEKMFNKEILFQFSKNPNTSDYDELKKFINNNKIDLTKKEDKEYIHAGKLILDGAVNMISDENTEEIAEIVNTVAINPRDKFYVFIKQGDDRDTYLLNMAGYFNNILKSALSCYKGDDVYKGVKNGVKFVVEHLLGEQIQKSATRNLTTIEKEQTNKFLKDKGIELIV